MGLSILVCFLSNLALGAELPHGEIIDQVKCLGDPSQSYALYLPSNYAVEKPMSLLIAFDPRARGRAPVERFQAGAEKYGYIVAGSNNSRNGSWEISTAAVRAMLADIEKRFAIDPHRLYTAGLSGGARVAMQVALAANGLFAGVIASSAGYPDSQPRKTAPFAIFGTAGTEDFNYLEMRRLDQPLKSPHHVAIFEGGHTWLSAELATEALEWMEVQAMKSKLRARDNPVIDAIFSKRLAVTDALPAGLAQALALESIVSSFEGLRDVSLIAKRATALRSQKAVRAEMKKDEHMLAKEEMIMVNIAKSEAQLADTSQRADAMQQLKYQLLELYRKSNATADSVERRLARRILRGTAASSGRTTDAEYRALLQLVRQ